MRACAQVIGSALDQVANVDPMYMTTTDKAASLVELTSLSARLEALRLRVLASADDVALDCGARSAEAWLAHHTRSDVGSALSDGRLAESLESRWQLVRDGLADGSVNAAQARVITRALDELPADLDPGVHRQAEAHLVEQAAHFDPKRLRRLGRKVLEVVAPEVADEEELRLLEAEEARARRVASLTMRRRGDGTTDIHVRVADAVAGRLRTYLDAYTSPRRAHLDDQGGPGDQIDPDTGQHIRRSQLWATAFGAMLEAIPGDGLPRHGGAATTVLVTIGHDSLRDQLGVAGLLDVDESITVSEALRLACNASLLPAVLDTTGQPLHLGRSRRLFSPAQRTAMALRDRQCRTHGCTIPATWCEAHHRNLGREADSPTWTRAFCSARGTTIVPTILHTAPPPCPAATSGSTDGRRKGHRSLGAPSLVFLVLLGQIRRRRSRNPPPASPSSAMPARPRCQLRTASPSSPWIT